MNQQLLGARKERDAIRAKLRRMIRLAPAGASIIALTELDAWLAKRAARYNRRPGGLQSRRSK